MFFIIVKKLDTCELKLKLTLIQISPVIQMYFREELTYLMNHF